MNYIRIKKLPPVEEIIQQYPLSDAGHEKIMSQMISVTIPSQPMFNYPIMIGADLYDVASWLPQRTFSRLIIITDEAIKKQYGLRLQKCLKQAGHHSLLLSFPGGEKYKNNKTKEALENAMLLQRCDRDSLIIALGGGVVGDLAGYIAATYMRGIPYIQVPTTLLAMVDSSVGGKTGINTLHGKNLIGAVHQPLCVVTDLRLLKSLSAENRINGLIEAIKMFMTSDIESFYYIEEYLPHFIQGDEGVLKEVVARAVSIKADIIGRDEKDQGERSVLNFGHTIGHALENLSKYRMMHGYAVAYGILVEATLSHHLGLLTSEPLAIIKNMLSRLDFHGRDLKKYELNKLIQATKNDKKLKSNKVHYSLLSGLGSSYVAQGRFAHPVEDRMIREAFKSTLKEAKYGR